MPSSTSFNFRVLYSANRTKTSCLVIPILNEAIRFLPLIMLINEQQLFDIIDIIIVDGGSTDHSLEFDFCKMNVNTVLTMNSSKDGLSGQLKAAYSFALNQGYEYVITMDGNGKDNPAYVPLFLDYLTDGYDFVQASRFIDGGCGINTPIFREMAIRFVHSPLLSLSSGFFWTDTTQGFRGYSKTLLSSPKLQIFRPIFTGYSLLAYLNHAAPKLDFRCLEVPTIRTYSPGAHSSKINSIGSHFTLFWVLIKSVVGCYDAF